MFSTPNTVTTVGRGRPAEGVNAELESRPATFAKLSKHFFETFPQLEGLNFTHAWGGAIDTCSRFCVFWGQAMQGRVAYALGWAWLERIHLIGVGHCVRAAFGLAIGAREI